MEIHEDVSLPWPTCHLQQGEPSKNDAEGTEPRDGKKHWFLMGLTGLLDQATPEGPPAGLSAT